MSSLLPTRSSSPTSQTLSPAPHPPRDTPTLSSPGQHSPATPMPVQPGNLPNLPPPQQTLHLRHPAAFVCGSKSRARPAEAACRELGDAANRLQQGLHLALAGSNQATASSLGPLAATFAAEATLKIAYLEAHAGNAALEEAANNIVQALTSWAAQATTALCQGSADAHFFSAMRPDTEVHEPTKPSQCGSVTETPLFPWQGLLQLLASSPLRTPELMAAIGSMWQDTLVALEDAAAARDTGTKQTAPPLSFKQAICFAQSIDELCGAAQKTVGDGTQQTWIPIRASIDTVSRPTILRHFEADWRLDRMHQASHDRAQASSTSSCQIAEARAQRRCQRLQAERHAHSIARAAHHQARLKFKIEASGSQPLVAGNFLHPFAIFEDANTPVISRSDIPMPHQRADRPALSPWPA